MCVSFNCVVCYNYYICTVVNEVCLRVDILLLARNFILRGK